MEKTLKGINIDKIGDTREYFGIPTEELIESRGEITNEERLLSGGCDEVIYLDNEEEFKSEVDGIIKHAKKKGYTFCEVLVTVNERIAVRLAK